MASPEFCTRGHERSGVTKVNDAWGMLTCLRPSPPGINVGPGCNPENFFKLHMHAGKFYKILNSLHKSTPCKSKFFCGKTLVSLRPVNAGFGFNETSQIEKG